MGKFEIKIGKTYSFKLTSRDEVVAKIVDITDDAYITETPLIVAVTQESLQLIPSMFTTELTNTMPIFKHAVSLICETRVRCLFCLFRINNWN